MFHKKKYGRDDLTYNTTTRLMIKKVNKKYTLTCISIKKNVHWPLSMIKKVNKKYTLISINDKKGQ